MRIEIPLIILTTLSATPGAFGAAFPRHAEADTMKRQSDGAADPLSSILGLLGGLGLGSLLGGGTTGASANSSSGLLPVPPPVPLTARDKYNSSCQINMRDLHDTPSRLRSVSMALSGVALGLRGPEAFPDPAALEKRQDLIDLCVVGIASNVSTILDGFNSAGDKKMRKRQLNDTTAILDTIASALGVLGLGLRAPQPIPIIAERLAERQLDTIFGTISNLTAVLDDINAPGTIPGKRQLTDIAAIIDSLTTLLGSPDVGLRELPTLDRRQGGTDSGLAGLAGSAGGLTAILGSLGVTKRQTADIAAIVDSLTTLLGAPSVGLREVPSVGRRQDDTDSETADLAAIIASLTGLLGTPDIAIRGESVKRQAGADPEAIIDDFLTALSGAPITRRADRRQSDDLGLGEIESLLNETLSDPAGILSDLPLSSLPVALKRRQDAPTFDSAEVADEVEEFVGEAYNVTEGLIAIGLEDAEIQAAAAPVKRQLTKLPGGLTSEKAPFRVLEDD